MATLFFLLDSAIDSQSIASAPEDSLTEKDLAIVNQLLPYLKSKYGELRFATALVLSKYPGNTKALMEILNQYRGNYHARLSVQSILNRCKQYSDTIVVCDGVNIDKSLFFHDRPEYKAPDISQENIFDVFEMKNNLPAGMDEYIRNKAVQKYYMNIDKNGRSTVHYGWVLYSDDPYINTLVDMLDNPDDDIKLRVIDTLTHFVSESPYVGVADIDPICNEEPKTRQQGNLFSYDCVNTEERHQNTSDSRLSDIGGMLVSLADVNDGELRLKALQAVGVFKSIHLHLDDDAISKLIRIAKEETGEIKKAAIDAMPKCYDLRRPYVDYRKNIDKLIATAQQTDKISQELCFDLERYWRVDYAFCDLSNMDLRLEGFRSDKECLKYNSALAISNFGKDAAVMVPEFFELMKEGLHRTDGQLRKYSDALVRIGRPSIPILLECVENEDKLMKSKCLSVIGKMGTKVAKMVEKPLLDVFENNKTELDTQKSILETLLRTGLYRDAAKTRVLQLALNFEDLDLQALALRAYANLVWHTKPYQIKRMPFSAHVKYKIAFGGGPTSLDMNSENWNEKRDEMCALAECNVYIH